MNYAYLATLAVFGLLVGAVGLICAYFERRAHRIASARPDYEQPRIARLSIARMRCRLCSRPLLDGNLVVWHERANGWRSDTAHAECAVLIKKAGGAVERLSGDVVPTYPGGGVIGPPVPGVLLLTEAEWAAWVGGAPVRTELPS